MNSDPCVKCQKPLNGGVYRKPNLCPHCFSIQDETLNAKGKPLRGKAVAKQESPVTTDIAAEAAQESIAVNNDKKVEAIINSMFQSESPQPEAAAEEEFLEEDAYEEVAESTIFDEDKTLTEVEDEYYEEEYVENEYVEDDYAKEESSRIEPTIGLEEEKTQLMPSRESKTEAVAAKVEEKAEDDTPEAAKVEETVSEEEAPILKDAVEAPAAELDLDAIKSPTIFDEPAANYTYERSDDEELYDDYSGIDDDMLIDDENGIVENDNEDALVARATTQTENYTQEMNESLDIKLKLVPSSAEESDVAVTEQVTRKAAAQSNTGYESVVLTSETARDIEVEKYLDIVTAECVFETNMVRSDFPRQGRKTNRSMSVVQDARKTVLDTLKQDAFRLGANTVIGLNIDYSEFTRGNQPMMMVVATGTAIRTSKEAVA